MKLEQVIANQRKRTSATSDVQDYVAARERYAEVGVDADAAVETVLGLPISVHCWQADDVRGLEVRDGPVDSGGVQATGNYPGAAQTGDHIRQDFEQAARLIPGALRFNLHAMYAETGQKLVERDELTAEHFATWVDWAYDQGWGLDLNPTCFAHPLAADGMTLAHSDDSIRQFWVRHCLACREIAEGFGKKLGSCTYNIWIPDGRKDVTVDRAASRQRLIESLDTVLEADLPNVADVMESKLFGISLENYTVGSHEFYLLYAASRDIGLCFDLGHYHPTESVADKLSATVPFVSPVLLHISRGVRWDSDHVPRFSDEVRAVCDEAVRGDMLRDVLWATDFFDASINRVAAWVIGVRAVRKALLYALLEPGELAAEAEQSGDGAAKLALQELRAELPFSAVWEYACQQADVPSGLAWLAEIQRYEETVLVERC